MLVSSDQKYRTHDILAGAIVTVTGKAVELPDDDHIEQVLVAVLNHLLKCGAMVCPCGKGTVDVVLQNSDIVLLRESRTLADLSFDGFLALVVGRIAGVDDCFHNRFFHLFSMTCLIPIIAHIQYDGNGKNGETQRFPRFCRLFDLVDDHACRR